MVVWVCGGVCVVMVDQWWYGCVEVYCIFTPSAHHLDSWSCNAI